MIDDLKQIKKYYGENMMHLCRELFSTLLETPGLLFKLLEDNFIYSKYLYTDIVQNELEEEFKDYIYSLVDVEEKEINIKKSPYILLKEAGYNLYECKTEEDIQSFKKYYSKGEELCTFWGGRLNRCHVFFAVKENVNEIKREDFQNPQRQDEYGTSVISIQFTRGNINTLSIKNRYNHTVNNPDATFSNNLENIIEGLTASFEKEYNLNISKSNNIYFEIPGYMIANDGKYYKYNYEINNIYYCPDNIIIDNFKVIKEYQDKEKYLITDYFILDLMKKEIKLFDPDLEDSFIEGLKDIKNIEIKKEKETVNKYILITPKVGNEIIIKIDKHNRIVEYKNENLEQIGNNFLQNNESLINIDFPNLEVVGNNFLLFNRNIEHVEFDNLEKIGDNFLFHNISFIELNFPKLKQIGDGFFYQNCKLKDIKFPELAKIGSDFMRNNEQIKTINFPNLKIVGSNFLIKNNNLKTINLPKLEMIGSNFMKYNESIEEIYLPQIKRIGNNFLYYNRYLKNINFPELVEVWSEFLCYNENLTSIDLPKLEMIEDNFICFNKKISSLNVPSLKEAGDCFLFNNESLKNINMPKLKKVGDKFLVKNNLLIDADFPNLKKVGDDFLYNNESLENINVPKLEKVGEDFLYYNIMLKYSLKRSIYKKKLHVLKDLFLEEIKNFNLQKINKKHY